MSKEGHDYGPYVVNIEFDSEGRRIMYDQPTEDVLKSSEDWAEQFYDVFEIIDPDGWDRAGDFNASWAEPIPEDEWIKRAMRSTVVLKDLEYFRG